MYTVVLWTHKESGESPLLSGNLVLDEVISTTGHTVDSIVTTHDASHIALTNTRLESWEICLKNLTF